jgi:hypothetical protein
MSDQTQEEPERLGPSPEEQEETKARQESELQAQRDEHNRRVAPGGAEIEDISNPPKQDEGGE